jgi:hypothetical protein
MAGWTLFAEKRMMIKPLEELSAEEILAAEFFPIYQSEMNGLWQQILEMNSSIFILEKIESFPFHIFGDKTPFWILTKNALFERVLMIIWRISIDEDVSRKGEPHLTIPRLKRLITKNLNAKSSVHGRELASEFKNIDRIVKYTRDKVADIRNNFLGHLNHEFNTNPRPKKIASIAIQLADLMLLQAKINKMFELLSFNALYLPFYPEYDPNVIISGRPATEDTDIGQLLDDIARNSAALNMPEDNPLLWKYEREDLEAADLQIINEYRRKFGLSDA